MAIAAKGFIATGATGGTTGAIVFEPDAGTAIRITGIMITGGTIGGNFSLIVNDGTSDYNIIDSVPIVADDSVDFSPFKPVNILSGWTLKASFSEGMTVSISGEQI